MSTSLKVATLFSKSYLKKVLNIDRANLILYHPMNELSGGVAIDKSSEGNDGAYTGVDLGQPGIGDGFTCPLFDGANDYNNAFSAGLASDFDGEEGSFAAWVRVSAAGVWTDGIKRDVARFRVDVNNIVEIYKSTSNNVINLSYISGGVTKNRSFTALTSTDWIHFALTWSKSGDESRYYMDGAEHGSGKHSGLGAWAGAITTAFIGALSGAPLNVWDGWLAHPGLWKAQLNSDKVAKLAVK
jgi:hypothetical protein